MGIYFNPDNANFSEIVNREIYVDKTMMIDTVNHIMDRGNKYICLSRPRRFGKTIVGNMLVAYYSKGCDSSALFAPFKISKAMSFSDKLNKYNVIQIDLNSEYQNIRNKDNLIISITDKVLDEMRIAYPDIDLQGDLSLGEAILKVYASTGETFIIIIDEYDVLVREQASGKLFDDFLSFLNGLFKSNTLRPAISLAYLTGILPIVRDKVQSKLNNFREYTFINPGIFTKYVGFTAEEVQRLCGQYDMDFDECRRWYDGYTLNGIEIYNPESVVMCMEERRYEGYWGRTSSYMAIADRIRQNLDGIREDVICMLSDENIDVNVTRYMNTMDSFHTRSDVFTYLIHLGYLSYDIDTHTCSIPNREVRQEWFNAIEDDEDYRETNRIIESSRQLLEDTIKGNERAVARALDDSHIHVTSNRSYNNEDALQSAIYLAYIYALNKYTIIKEMTTGKGFADVVFIPFVPDMPAMIIELKRNDSTESAITQIRDRKYYDSLSHYSGELLFVGINYDEKNKIHECVIEKFGL